LEFDDARKQTFLIDTDADTDTDPAPDKSFVSLGCPQCGPFFPGAVREKK
jgi:hypothetical protein